MAAMSDIDLMALREYFTFQNIYSDRTLFKDVRSATWSIGDLDKLRSPLDISRTECAKKLRKLLDRAVKKSIPLDEPVGCLLGGGIDSGTIVALASNHTDKLCTYTCGYANFPPCDEREAARLVADTFKVARHYVLPLTSTALSNTLPTLAECIESPRMSINYQDYLIYGLASRDVRVVLSGAGGDELFAGYPWKYEHPDHYRLMQRLVVEEEHAEFFTPAVIEATREYSVKETYDSIWKDQGSELNSRLYFDLKTCLPGLLSYLSKIAAKHKIEIRYPFLDYDVVDFALGIPAEYKYNGGLGKMILREAMRGLLPDEILRAPKQGFVTPDREWFRGPTSGYIYKTLLSQGTRCHEYIQPSYIGRVLREHTGSIRDWHLLIWSLLCFEHWLWRFM